MALLGLVLGIWGVLDWRAIADTGRIQGTWKVVSARHDGIEVLSGDWNFTRFRFAGDRITLERWMNSYEGTFQLRSCSSKPCECDFSLYVHKWVHWSAWSLTRCSLARLKMGYGIYEFEGDHLRICIFLQNLDPVTRRPKDFTAGWNDSQWLYVLEREGNRDESRPRRSDSCMYDLPH